jgi:hypothetical protein
MAFRRSYGELRIYAHLPEIPSDSSAGAEIKKINSGVSVLGVKITPRLVSFSCILNLSNMVAASPEPAAVRYKIVESGKNLVEKSIRSIV